MKWDLLEDIILEIGLQYANRYDKMPARNSVLAGSAKLAELLTSENETPFREQMRMGREAFLTLCRELTQRGLLSDSLHINAQEQVAIFLFIVGQNQSNRAAQDKFQHSGETISK